MSESPDRPCLRIAKYSQRSGITSAKGGQSGHLSGSDTVCSPPKREVIASKKKRRTPKIVTLELDSDDSPTKPPDLRNHNSNPFVSVTSSNRASNLT